MFWKFLTKNHFLTLFTKIEIEYRFPLIFPLMYLLQVIVQIIFGNIHIITTENKEVSSANSLHLHIGPIDKS